MKSLYEFNKIILFFMICLQLLICSRKSFAQKSCEDYLISNNNVNSSTKELLNYILDLSDKKLISNEDLQFFIESLKNGIIVNPISNSKARSKTTLWIHRQGLQKKLDHDKSNLETSYIIFKLEDYLRDQSEVIDQRQKTSKETENNLEGFDFILFNPKNSSVRLNPNWQSKDRGLPDQIEINLSPITLGLWMKVMGEKPDKFTDAFIEEKSPEYISKSDIPVENITMWSAMVYANRLSEIYGYTPAYDLSKVRVLPTTRAENGTLIGEGQITMNSIDGDYKTAHGFRLPLKEELEAFDLVLQDPVYLSELVKSNPRLSATIHRISRSLISYPLVSIDFCFYECGNEEKMSFISIGGSRGHVYMPHIFQTETKPMNSNSVDSNRSSTSYWVSPSSISSNSRFRLVRSVN